MPGVQVGVGYVDIKPDLSGFGRQLKTEVGRGVAAAGDDAGKSLKTSLASAARGAAAAFGAAFATVKIGDFLGSAIQGASDLSESVNKSNQVFGSSALIISGWAEAAAKSIGLSKREAFDAAGTFGNMFAQLGIGSEQAASMSIQMVNLAADFASFHNADISDVIAAQSSAFRGEYDALQRYLPTITAATVEQRALALTGKKTTASLTAQDKALAVNKLMMEGAGDATGDFARTSDGLANQQRIVSAEWANAKTELGEGLLPIMTSLVGFVNDQLVPAFKTMFTTGGEATGWAATVREVIGDLVGFLLGTLQQVLRVMANLADKVPFGWAKGAAVDLRHAADSADEARASLHASKAELLEWAGATRNADLAAKLLTFSTKAAAGAVDAQSKSIRENSKATRDAAASERSLRQAKKDLAQLLAEGAVNDKDVADARKSLADATRDAAHADRELRDAQREYDQALAASNILGTDTAMETLADAADDLADATENSADAHDKAKTAAADLAKAQAGDPEFQDKLADARDKVANAEDKVADAEAKTVALTPAFVGAVGLRTEAVKLLNDQLGVTEGHLGILNDKGNILSGLGPAAPIIPAPASQPSAVGMSSALPSNLIGIPNVQMPASTTNYIDVHVTEPVQDPLQIGKAISWIL